MPERISNHQGKISNSETKKIKLRKAGTNVLLGLSGASMFTGFYFMGEAVHTYPTTPKEIESRYPSPTAVQKMASEEKIDHFSEQIDQAIKKQDFKSAVIFQSKKKEAEKTIQLWNSHVKLVLKEKSNSTKEYTKFAVPLILGGSAGGAVGLFMFSTQRKDGIRV